MEPRSNRNVNAFIAGCLLFQLAVPLSYYFRSERSDERFAWRMYSAQRLRACRISVWEDRGATPSARWTRVRLEATLHPGWISALRFGVASVRKKFLRARCNLGASRVRIDRQCRTVDGARLRPQRIETDCAASDVGENRP